MNTLKIIWTIGHSTHEASAFLMLLRKHNINTLCDVRSAPSSKWVPHFNKECMSKWLTENNINYKHFPSLGGHRSGKDKGLNGGWRVRGFRTYADYALSDAFEEGLKELTNETLNGNVAYMCSEAPWWKCHRRIISDYLSHGGWDVNHIMPTSCISHSLTDFCVPVGSKLHYPPLQTSLF